MKLSHCNQQNRSLFTKSNHFWQISTRSRSNCHLNAIEKVRTSPSGGNLPLQEQWQGLWGRVACVNLQPRRITNIQQTLIFICCTVRVNLPPAEWRPRGRPSSPETSNKLHEPKKLQRNPICCSDTISPLCLCVPSTLSTSPRSASHSETLPRCCCDRTLHALSWGKTSCGRKHLHWCFHSLPVSVTFCCVGCYWPCYWFMCSCTPHCNTSGKSSLSCACDLKLVCQSQ